MRKLNRVERAKSNAIIGREAADENLVDVPLPEILGEARRAALRVVEERAVTVDIAVNTLSKNSLETGRIKCRRELGASTILDTMRRPENLRDTVQIDDLTDLVPRVIRGKASVLGRMPILGGQHEIKAILESIDHGDHFVPSWYCQRTAGQKIVLDVNDN